MLLRLFFIASGLFTEECGLKMRVPVMSPWRGQLVLVVVVVGTLFRKFSGKWRIAAAEGVITLHTAGGKSLLLLNRNRQHCGLGVTWLSALSWGRVVEQKACPVDAEQLSSSHAPPNGGAFPQCPVTG